MTLQRTKPTNGMALIAVLIIVAVVSIGMTLALTSVRQGISFGGFMNKKATRETIVWSNFRRAQERLKTWGDEIGTPKLTEIDGLADGYRLNSADDNIPAEERDYATWVVVTALPGNPADLMVGGLKKYVVESIAHH